MIFYQKKKKPNSPYMAKNFLDYEENIKTLKYLMSNIPVM